MWKPLGASLGTVQGKERKCAAKRCSCTRGQNSPGKKSQAQEIMGVENAGRRAQPH